MESDFSAYDHSLSLLWDDYRENPNNAELLHALCCGLNLRGQHRTCAKMAREGLAQHPNHTNLYYELLIAKSLVADEDLSVIGPEVENMFQARPGDLGTKRNLALYYFYMENDADAARLLNEILDQFDQDQVDQGTYEVLAQLEHANEHLGACLEYCNRGLAKPGPGARIVRLKGLCLVDLGKNQLALACFEQALDLEPYFIWACHSLGRLFFEKGEFKKGLAYFGRAMAINPSDPNNYFQLAEAFMEQGSYRLAASELEKLIWCQPNGIILAEAHNALGYLFMQEEDFDLAKKHLSKAINLSPDMAVAYFNLGLLSQHKGVIEQAEASFNQALELDSQYVEAWLALGFLYMGSNQWEAAETSFQTTIDLDPESASAYLGLSQLAQARALPENQLMYAKTAAQLDPHNGNILAQLGLAFMANQMVAEAQEAFANSLQLDPTQIQVMDELQSLLNQRITQAPEEAEKHRRAGAVIWQAFLQKVGADSPLREKVIANLSQLGFAPKSTISTVE